MFKFLSQIGQDIWVIENVFNHKRSGYFVDLAANNGTTISNTLLLEKELGWDGICIEPNPFFYEELMKNRTCELSNDVVDSESGKFVDFRIDNGLLGGVVASDTDNKPEDISAGDAISVRLRTKTLEEILIDKNSPSIIDYLSLDVEGCEMRILENFPFNKYTFLTLTIERPSSELNSLLFKNGYVFVMNCFFDTFYIHSSITNFMEIKKEPFTQIEPFKRVQPPDWFSQRIIRNYGENFTPFVPNPVPSLSDVASYACANSNENTE